DTRAAHEGVVGRRRKDAVNLHPLAEGAGVESAGGGDDIAQCFPFRYFVDGGPDNGAGDLDPGTVNRHEDDVARLERDGAGVDAGEEVVVDIEGAEQLFTAAHFDAAQRRVGGGTGGGIQRRERRPPGRYLVGAGP